MHDLLQYHSRCQLFFAKNELQNLQEEISFIMFGKYCMVAKVMVNICTVQVVQYKFQEFMSFVSQYFLNFIIKKLCT